MSGSKLPLSVAIITYNEEDIIGRTLEAVHDIAQEIIVVDSHSTDRTREIAKAYGAKVFVEDWKGHVKQKNSALEKCTQEWILALDADEVVSEELKESIVSAIRYPQAEGYYLNRKTYYMGKFLEHTWQPEWRLRLVRKSACPTWTGQDPHDKLVIKGRTAKLEGFLYHYSFKDLKDHIFKSIAYAQRSAEVKFIAGEKASLLNLILNPVWAFIKIFLLKKGFLDGMRGLIASAVSSFYVFAKYAFLYEKQLKPKL